MLDNLCKERGVALNKVNVDAHAKPLHPSVSHYTSLPIVLVISKEGEMSFSGSAVTARTMSEYIR